MQNSFKNQCTSAQIKNEPVLTNPQGYISCAGDYCVHCYTFWWDREKTYATVCLHWNRATHVLGKTEISA